LTTNSFRPSFISQVIVVKKHHCSIVGNANLPTRAISYTVTGKRQVRKNILVDQRSLQIVPCFQ